MEMINSYKDYRSHKPEYKSWKNELEDKEAKRLAYLKNNDIPEAQKQADMKRARAVINAIDVMDEYSQTRAEDTEMLVQGVVKELSGLIVYPGLILGTILSVIKATKKGTEISFDTLSKAVMQGGMIGGSITTLMGYPFLAQWGAKKETEASQNGRFEAMVNELSSVKQFASLNEEQEKQIKELAPTIEVDKKEAKNVNTAKGGILHALKMLLGKEENEITKARKEFKEQLQQHEEKFDKVPLSEKDIEEAKHDQQLIQNIVEKIDIASQSYAEDVELATDAYDSAGLGGGIFLGAVVYKLLGLLKVEGNKKLYSAVAAGGLLSLATEMLMVKIQKQASRVGRFKAKQEFLNNPDKLIYVDDEKLKDIDGSQFKQKNKKPNIFKFLVQIIKENKEYNDYIKAEGARIKQESKAREQIELTPEQEKRAHQLQQNTFKMFNKLDDKSQKYAEHVEALGETFSNTVSALLGLFSLSGLTKSKLFEPEFFNSPTAGVKEISQAFGPFFKRILIIFPFITALNIYVTKEQKKASRVADMLAIKETQDYRHFVDYDNLSKVEPKSESGTQNQQNKEPKANNAMSPLLQKMIK